MAEPPGKSCADVKRKNNKRIKCTKCNLFFNRNAELDNHIKENGCEQEVPVKRTYTKRLFECKVCRLKLDTAKLLKDHEREVHFKVGQMCCPICESPGFKYLEKLREHLTENHQWKGEISTEKFESLERKYIYFFKY